MRVTKIVTGRQTQIRHINSRLEIQKSDWKQSKQSAIVLETFRLSFSYRVSQLKLSVRIQTSADWLHSLRKKLVSLYSQALAILTAEGDEYLWSESKAFASNAKITLIWILQPVWSSHYWSRSHSRMVSRHFAFVRQQNLGPETLSAGEGVAFCPWSADNASHSLAHAPLVPTLIELSSHLQMQRVELQSCMWGCKLHPLSSSQEFRQRAN